MQHFMYPNLQHLLLFFAGDFGLIFLCMFVERKITWFVFKHKHK